MKSEKEELRQKLFELLGDLPPIRRDVSGVTIGQVEQETYFLEKLLLDLNGLEGVPAYFAKPKNIQGKAPVILFNHSHGGNYQLGKDELIKGNIYLQQPDFAGELTGKGYAVLAIDAWGFGERRGRTESEIFKEMLWKGRVMWGMMVYDSIKAVDYLLSRPEIDGTRIATIGLSMGATMSWWLAALDERIKVCVDMCGLTDYQALIDSRGLDHHGIYYYVPSLFKYFTTARINSLIAPRCHFSLAGRYDKLTPFEGLGRIDDELIKVYQNEGAREGCWKLKIYDSGHYETMAMRKDALEYLGKWL